jgi:hypothetical protein
MHDNHGELMTRILLPGYAPKTVDFSDPDLPPGMTVEKVHVGVAVAVKQFAERGESPTCVTSSLMKLLGWGRSLCTSPQKGKPPGRHA